MQRSKRQPDQQHVVDCRERSELASALVSVPREGTVTEQKVGQDHLLCTVEVAYMVGSVTPPELE